MTGVRVKKAILWAALLTFLVAIPLLLRENYLLRVATTVVLNIILASSLNLINGYSGQFSLGHAGFYCVGAYTAAILATRYQVSFWLLLPLSGLAAAAFSVLLGLPTLRLKGVFLAVATLGFSEIIRLTVLNWSALTRGPFGIPGIPFPRLFNLTIRTNAQFYYLALVIAALMLFSTYRIIHSRIGRAWIAIREDERSARAMGVEAFRYKLLNFAIGTFWAGVAGCFYAFFASYISPDSFKLDEGFSILAMVLVGGQGSLLGPILGATFLTVLPELFRGLAEYRMLIFGLIIILTMLVRPQGIAGGTMWSAKRSKARSGSQGNACAREVA
ncbi:MAG: branched-chain amino acid ABC transporter permease [Bacillota bacterium]|nr:branched-chain amino acid ABC transporter permease [Bacillota bacterium]